MGTGEIVGTLAHVIESTASPCLDRFHHRDSVTPGFDNTEASNTVRNSRNARSATLPILSALIAILALVLTACGGSDDGDVDLSKDLPTEIPAGTKIVFADQQNKYQTLLAASGLEKDLPYKLSYANFTGGPAVLEAFRAGTADVAGVGDVPPIHAQLTDQKVPIILALQNSLTTYGLATAPGSNVKTAADLRGKKFAYAEGTAQQAVVLRALANAGLTVKDVQLVKIKLAEFSDALGAKQVDVAPLNEPRLTRYLRDFGCDGASTVDTASLGRISEGLSYVYARGESLTDPAKAAALRYLEGVLIKAYQWANTHPAEWIDKYYVKNQNVTADDGWRILRSTGTIAFPPLDDALITRQQATIDVLDKAGQLPKKVRAADDFDLRFAPVIEEAKKESGAPSESGVIR